MRIAIVLLLLLPGCATTNYHTGDLPFCLTYQPVYWSAKDTRKTKEQVDANNRVWKAMCKK